MRILFLIVYILSFSGSSVAGSRFDNGYPEKRFNKVLDDFFEHFSGAIESLGGTFEIQRDWSDGAVNAWGWREADKYILEVPGGLPRYSLINEQAFILVLCHELGHILGGAPTKGLMISSEGQSDYFSIQKCFRPFVTKIKPFFDLPLLINEKAEVEVNELCKSFELQYECFEAIYGSLVLTGYYAELSGVMAPRLSTPDPNVVQKTLKSHPSPQCRLDTLVRSMSCLSDPAALPSWLDPLLNYCSYSEGLRPTCWYK